MKIKNQNSFKLGLMICLAPVFLFAQSSGSKKAQDTMELPLVTAIERGDIKGFKKELVKNSALNSDVDLKQAVQYAIVNPESEFLNLLLKDKSASDLVKRFLRTESLLQEALVQEAPLKNFKLAEKHLDISTLRFEKKSSALHRAIEYGEFDIVKHIAQSYPSLISVLDEDGESILFKAVRRSHMPTFEFISKLKGLPKVKKNKQGQTPLQLAKELGYEDIAKKLK